MSRTNHYSAIMLAVMGILLLSVSSVYAADINCTYLSGNNIEKQNYSVWSSPIKSYLTVTDDGYMRVQAGKKLHAIYYDKDFNVTSRKTIPSELGVFGGFYESDDNYYIVTGAENYDEEEGIEELRVTKYTKDWERLGSDSLYDSNTAMPFEAGSLRMCMAGKYLYIRSCHLMYNGHQANIMMVFDTEEMKITDYKGGVSNINTGYVSHSFNQFIQYQDGVLYTFDHGDAYPRAGVIVKYPMDVPTDTMPERPDNYLVKEFTGETGDNDTGASFGGFEVGTDHILIAGNQIPDSEYDENGEYTNTYNHDVVLYSVDKEGSVLGDVKTVYITSYKKSNRAATTPHLVRTGENEYILLWTDSDDDQTVYYVKVNGQAELLSDVQQIRGNLSDCKPIVVGSELIWFTWNKADERLYKINTNDISDVKVIRKNFDHEYETQSVSKGVATLKCSKCGETAKGLVPMSFSVEWTRNYSFVSEQAPKVLQTGDMLRYRMFSSYADQDYDTYSDYIVKTSDPANAEVDIDEDMVTFHKAGTYTLTMYPKFNPDLKKKVTIKIQNDTKLKATGKKVKVKYSKLKKKNQTVARTKAISVKNNFNGVRFKKKSGNKKISVASSGKITLKKGLKKGKYPVKIKVIDKGGPFFNNKTVTVTVTLNVA